VKLPTLSAVVSVHNEENCLAACLETLTFADELVVILDRCTDCSQEISKGFGAVISKVLGSAKEKDVMPRLRPARAIGYLK